MTASPPVPRPPLTAIPADITCLADYERHAAGHLPEASRHHVDSGTGEGLTLHDNRAAFGRIRLAPRALADLRQGSTRTLLLGQWHESPILLAPVAFHRLAHSGGECETARAAAALQVGMAVSTLSSQPLEDIAAASRAASAELHRAPAPLWFQLYFQRDREHSLALVRRAQAAGYQAVVVTVDASVKRSGFPLPQGVEAVNVRGYRSFEQRSGGLGGPILIGTPLIEGAPTWDDIAWLRANCPLPLIVKGVVSPRDALRAIELGADALVVSNHGGRVLDGLPAAIDVLPRVAAAVAGRVPLLLDGGVRTGTDIVKSLALGASAVMIGRPQVHALAVAGLLGVAHALHLLRGELELAMAQLGCASIGEIDAGILWPAHPGTEAGRN